MLSNKDIVNAYKKHKKQAFVPRKREYQHSYIQVLLALLVLLAPILPMLAVNLYLERSLLELVLGSAAAFVSFWSIFMPIMRPFAFSSSHDRSERFDNAMLLTAFIAFVPQLVFILLSILMM